MTHLVTGYKGEEHIKSEDQGSFNASFFGTGQFVMEAGSQLEASITSNNNVRVFDGDILMKGRHIRINTNTYEDMTIITGTAGKNRNDLIVMTYEKNSSDGTEDAFLEVIKGTETEGTASDPEYTDGDILGGEIKNQMPLYRVKIEGVVLTEIEQLFDVIPTYATLSERYKQEFIDACNSHLDSLNIYDTIEEVEANTQEQQLTGALALKAHSTNKSNPHGVTKSQVGLGNVPNVSTNDQTPSYTEASSIAALTSGEKISVAFGKIAKAVSTLISHITTAASSSVLGHVKTGTGLGNSSGTISVSYGTASGTACQGNDSRLSDSRTPKSHAATSTTYGGATASNYGHVKLSDTYASKESSGAAANSVGASQNALYNAYNTLNDKFGVTVSGTLSSGSTSITLSNSAISDSKHFDYYTSIYGVSPTSVTVASGSITLEFDAQETDMTVEVRVM